MKSATVYSNFIWRFMERCGAQGITFVVSIILARLLNPVVYGTVSLVSVFIAILGVFVDGGFGSALIQKKDVDELDFSSVFWFNICMCIVIYAFLYVTAPWVARFYENLELIPIVRVTSLTILISGVKNIQQAYVSKYLLFKRFFFATLWGTVGAAVVGIWMAYLGFGVWALVIQNLFNQVVDTVILWITVKWRPKREFSFGRLRTLFSYGWKLLVSGLLDTGYGKLRDLIIGKMYSQTDLAFYNKGGTFPSLIVSNINSSIDSVLLPTMSAEQDNRDRVKEMTRRAIKTSTYLMMPLMMGLAICAKPIVSIVLTDKWLPCVPYLQIYCFTYAFWPIHTANLNAIKAMGHSDYFLRLEIIKKCIGLVTIGISMWYGVIWMARSMIITTIISQIINAYPNKKLLGYSYLEQMKDMLPQITLSCIMGTIVTCVPFLQLGSWATLLIQVPLGALIYFGGSLVFRIESFTYLRAMVKSVIGKYR